MPTASAGYDWKAIRARRKAIEKQLLEKGLVPGSSKWHAVLYRKMRH